MKLGESEYILDMLREIEANAQLKGWDTPPMLWVVSVEEVATDIVTLGYFEFPGFLMALGRLGDSHTTLKALQSFWEWLKPEDRPDLGDIIGLILCEEGWSASFDAQDMAEAQKLLELGVPIAEMSNSVEVRMATFCGLDGSVRGVARHRNEDAVKELDSGGPMGRLVDSIHLLLRTLVECPGTVQPLVTLKETVHPKHG